MRHCSDRKRHFRVYLSEDWIGLDEIWQRDVEWGKSDRVKFLGDRLWGAREKGQKLTFTITFSTQIPRTYLVTSVLPISRNLAEMRKSVRTNRFVAKI